MHGFRAGTALSVALALTAGGPGCAREEPAPLEDRYARRFMPPQAEWQRESEIPAEPQRYPRMVMWEVSSYPPGTQPTPAQRRAADELIARCRAAATAHGWFDYQKGLADGFHVPLRASGDPHDDQHYRNDAFLLDDRILDCDRPEYLMYYPNPDGTRSLVGFMFLARALEERGPQIGGPLTLWHYHIWNTKQCLERGVIVTGEPLHGDCPGGFGSHRSPEMLHVWFVDHPEGPFSSAMHLEQHSDPDGLDAPFAVAEQDDAARFGAELEAAIARLDAEARPVVSQSVSYLIFALGRGYTPEGELRPLAADAPDPEARGREALLQAVRRRGSRVRMRLFVGMAAELDALRPEIWTEFERLHGPRQPHEPEHHH